jgi:hypothetical protein
MDVAKAGVHTAYMYGAPRYTSRRQSCVDFSKRPWLSLFAHSLAFQHVRALAHRCRGTSFWQVGFRSTTHAATA